MTYSCTSSAALPSPSPIEAMDLQHWKDSAEAACRLLKAMSNPDRLLLLCQLAKGRMCVGELEASVGVAQPTLSQQLGILRDEGLASATREGKRVYYELASPQASALMAVLAEQFCKPNPVN